MLLALQRTKIFTRYSSRKSLNDVVIVSAVRTPITGYRSHLRPLTATQLGAIAIEGAVKQAAIPLKDIQQAFIGNVFTGGVGQAPVSQATLLAGLPKTVCCTTINQMDASGLKTIMLAAECLQAEQAHAVVAGGMESMSNVPSYIPRGSTTNGGIILNDGILEDALTSVYNGLEMDECARHTAKLLCISEEEQQNYVKAAYKRAREACVEGAYDAELVPVRIQEKRQQKVVSEDESIESTSLCSNLADGAAALVLTTSAIAARLHLKPLARIIDFTGADKVADNFATATVSAVSQLLKRNGIDKEHIARWEINDGHVIVPLAFIKQMQVDAETVNVHGGSFAFGQALGMCGVHLITHLAHSLQSGELGCATIANGDGGGASAMLIEKISNSTSASRPPLITLYTKDPCPLCDVLVEELETHFAGQFDLEKLYITDKKNERFLSLYRNDIPVLFLNGQFLCMHKLNVNLLRRKLAQIKGSFPYFLGKV